MPPLIYYENKLLICNDLQDLSSLKRNISQRYGLFVEDLFVTVNGKISSKDENQEFGESVVRVCNKLVGGKGGFGSMLRAIGAQIEKTTNREACRDLSGRRLRDINEEKRLRKWLEGQEDREKEAIERKQKKIERLLAEPKINIDLNAAYEKDRKELPERVSAAVDAGWQAAGSSGEAGIKRRAEEEKVITKKKQKLWIDADLSDCSSLSEDEDEKKPTASPVQTVSTDSGNESDQTIGISSKT